LTLPSTLRASREGRVAILELARSEKRNALDDPTVAGIERFFDELEAEVGAVVLCGEGPHFSSGLDLSTVDDIDILGGVAKSSLWYRAFEKIEFGRVPVIAALHGAVVGGGLELAAAAHLRVADRTAFYALPEGQRGIFVGGGGSVRLPRLIGTARMMDMMLTGRVYDAEAGQAIGITHYLVDPGSARAKALELAQLALGNSRMTNFAIIHALPRIAEADPKTGYLLEALTAAVALTDEEAKRRVEDFLRKRAPKVQPP
jgi:enoyl-CoA hydratase/carnithine racemase